MHCKLLHTENQTVHSDNYMIRKNRRKSKVLVKITKITRVPILPAIGNPHPYVYCVLCKKAEQCKHWGRGEAGKYYGPKKEKNTHKKNVITIKLSSKLPYASHTEEALSNAAATTKAELLHTNMIVLHNVQFAVDYLS